MEVKQIFELVNSVTSEVLGKTDLIAEDLSNVVDVGTEIFNQNAVDAYVKSLVNHIGRVIFVNRPYSGSVPSVLMDSWEFGSVLEKIQTELPDAEENDSWNLTNKTPYDPNIFYQPTVTTKFYNNKVTFEVNMSFTEKQVKQSFSNAEQLNGFLSMLYTAVENSMSIKMDALIMRTINNMIGETLVSEFSEGEYNTKSGIRAVNLLHLYKAKFPEVDLTPEEAITDPEFIRFAVYTLSLYSDRLTRVSNLFNVGGKSRFTPKDLQHIVMLSDFINAANIYLQSDTFHDMYTALPKSESVPFWQGSGTSYSFADVSDIHISTVSGHEVVASGILAVIFDRDSLGVSNVDRRVTTNYNPKAEFFTNFYKYEASYYNDLNENFVVFFVA